MLSLADRLALEVGEDAPRSKAGPRKAANGQAPRGGGLFGLANGLDTIAILDRLGIPHESTQRGEMAKCPGCGEDGSLVCENGGLKCFHDRCSHVGPIDYRGFRSNVDIVAESEQVAPTEAARRICEWFGIEVPKTEPANGNGAADSSPKAEEPWPNPVPLDDLSNLPAFPLDALPPAIADWVGAVAESTQTPPDLAGGLALAALAAAAQKRFEVEVRPGWTEPLSLFVVVALPPGERKSAVQRLATRAIRDWEAEQSKAMQAQIRASITAKAVKERRAKKALDDAAKTGSATDLQRATELDIELHEMRIPTAPRLVADDVTPEKLAALMHEYGGRMAVLSAEGGIFETVGGRYSDGIPNIDVLLKGHAGDQIRVDRKNSSPVHIDRPALTLGLCVQPDVIEGLSHKPQFRGRGLLGRCLFIMPQSRVGFREIAAPPMDGLIEETFNRLIRDLIDLPEERDDAGEIVPKVIRFSPAAQRALEAFAAAIEPRLAPGGDLEPIRDWATKLAGAVARIAGLLYLASGGGNSAYSANSADLQFSVKGAEKIGLYLLEHALAAFRTMGSDPALQGARAILNHLRRNRTIRTNRRELFNAMRGRFPKVEAMEAPLRVLEDHGCIRVHEPEPVARRGRRPSPMVEVNPKLL